MTINELAAYRKLLDEGAFLTNSARPFSRALIERAAQDGLHTVMEEFY